MPVQDPDDQYLRVAMMVMLSLALLAGVCATAIHWLGPVHRPMDRVLPPVASALFAGLLCALWLRPAWVGIITRIALCLAALALIAPAWLYTVQASLSPELRLIDMLPPISSLFAVFMAMLMIFVPGRRAYVAAAVGWLLVASPVLVYLLTHPGELGTPRGVDLVMAFGPASLILVVLLPVQRGLTGKIRRLASERDGIEVQLHRDPLTGVHSRLFGERVLRDVLARGGAAGLVMLDLDRFKAINDTYGHPAGDDVLRAVAASCERLLRPSECIARWGGEEFLVILPDVNAAALHGIADRLRVAITAVPVAPVAQVTASLGTAVLHPADTLDSALQRVDQALYHAKELGGNRVCASDGREDDQLQSLAARAREGSRLHIGSPSAG
ncbi:GGDEF domain-containing protein [Thermomonas sp. XSG]|uniref:GGDEF domain-containing protein n=1 Tax=Thermomonas sp. XSG TaxID=2771436 RepID=UPI0016815889|nr:GGDEF domain-containing protein [Thermomonas sp. XSG]QNU14092.1 GGDEF domain-containing protein [Thermomonas sp. XSG]